MSEKYETCRWPLRREKVEVNQPTVAPIYNNAMPGVDLGDQKASYYSDRRKFLKWTNKLIYRLFLRQTCVNAEILFNYRRPTKKRLSLLQFLQRAIHDWTGSGSTEAISSTTTKRQRCDH